MKDGTEELVRSVRRVTFAGMAVNVGIATLKGAGGVLCSSQALVTLFIAGALAVVAWELGAHAVRALLAGNAQAPGLAAFFCALASVVSKELLFHWTRRVARRA